MKQTKYKFLAAWLLACAAFSGAAHTQTFRTLNRFESNGYVLLKSSAAVTGELSVSTTSPTGYVLKLSSAAGAAGQQLFYVTNNGLTGIGLAAPGIVAVGEPSRENQNIITAEHFRFGNKVI